MPYCEGRIVHDADAHLMETPTWLRDHAEAAFRDRLPVLRYPSGNELRQTGSPEEQQRDLVSSFERLRERHGTEEYRADEEAEIMQRKNFAATGGFISGDRPRALDLLGFSSQLIFNTFHNGRLHDFEHQGDAELAYAAARAHNRGMLEFCSVDSRLLPSCYVPWSIPTERCRQPVRRWRKVRPRCWWHRDVLPPSHRAIGTCSECGPRRKRRGYPSCSMWGAQAS